MRRPLPSSEEIRALPADGGEDFNRLIHETSPYLRQHARNPVNWYPWGDEAFEQAAKEDKPVFLSVGYSSCHWCHVMEHESFEDETVARLLNRYFIAVKVDREERPDLDEIYMSATQIMTGRGGWPNSVVLTPNRRPWYAGTYYPRANFIQLLGGLQRAWSEQREDVETQARQLTEAIRSQNASIENGTGPSTLDTTLITRAVREIQQSYDPENGGMRGAPKFPPHAALRFLLSQMDGPDAQIATQILRRTLDGMANGGIHDQIGGGFHRYATDAVWFLPHFEKMLYDNGQLAWVYAEAWRQTRDPYYAEVCRHILSWAQRDMMHPQGGFFSAWDADSEGIEGKYYLWTRDEVLQVLGNETGTRFAALYQIREEGNYAEEASGKRTRDNIPYLRNRPSEHPEPAWISDAKTRLLNHRLKRIPPVLDHKILTSWNALMLAGFAHAGLVLNDENLTRKAIQTADFLLKNLRTEGRLARSWCNQEARIHAYLDDYAFLADALIDLYEATRDSQWLKESRTLLNALDESFTEDATGPYWFTSNKHESLLMRSRDGLDKAEPSGNGVAVRAWIRLAHHTGDPHTRKRAEEILNAFNVLMALAPRSCMTMLESLSLLLDQTPSRSIPAEEPIRFRIQPSDHPGQYTLLVDMDPGWHITAAQDAASSQSGIRWSLVPEGYGHLEVQLPPPVSIQVEDQKQPIQVYQVTLMIPLSILPNAPSSHRPHSIIFEYQACNRTRCLPIVQKQITLGEKVEKHLHMLTDGPHLSI